MIVAAGGLFMAITVAVVSRRCLCKSTKGMIEVERKIAADATLKSRMISQGWKQVSCVRLVDSYYDTKDCRLCFEDVWLRYRSTNRRESWELKVGPGIASQKHSAASYREITNQRDICDTLKEFITEAEGKSSVSQLVSQNVIKSLVRIASTRTSFRVKSHPGITIDIDQIDCGPLIAEVETFAKTEEDVSEARERVYACCRELDIPDTAPPAPGKMELALKSQRNDVLEALRIKRLSTEHRI